MPVSIIHFYSVFQEQEENKSATSWPEYYIDQLNSMAAVSNDIYFSLWIKKYLKMVLPARMTPASVRREPFLILKLAGKTFPM